jgi:hypothetical protein
LDLEEIRVKFSGEKESGDGEDKEERTVKVFWIALIDSGSRSSTPPLNADVLISRRGRMSDMVVVSTSYNDVGARNCHGHPSTMVFNSCSFALRLSISASNVELASSSCSVVEIKSVHLRSRAVSRSPKPSW